MNKNILTQIGLTEEQVKIYSFLAKNGANSVKIISRNTGIGRSFSYKILDQLEKLKLVIKKERPGKIALFVPQHPKEISDLFENAKRDTEKSYSDFGKIYGELISNFNMLDGKPNVQYLEGLRGMKIVYSEILEAGEDIMLISSPIGNAGDIDSTEFIHDHIRKQADVNIHVKIISAHDKQNPLKKRSVNDKKNLVERKAISTDELNIPAQILIYKDKVAITNFKDELITVLIESKYIHETFKGIFEYMWNKN